MELGAFEVGYRDGIARNIRECNPFEGNSEDAEEYEEGFDAAIGEFVMREFIGMG